MDNLLFLIMLVPLLGCVFVMLAPKNEHNAFKVTLFTLAAGALLLLRLAAVINNQESDIILNLWNSPVIFIAFKINISVIILQLAIYIALLICITGLKSEQRKNKEVLSAVLYFGWSMSGLMFANDLLTFYIFFCATMLPLYLLIGIYWASKQNKAPSLFFLFHLGCSLLLLMAVVLLITSQNSNLMLTQISEMKISPLWAKSILCCAVAAFVSRIPIWPFHYWIAAVSIGMRHSAVNVITGLVPLSGLYAIMKLYSLSVVGDMQGFEPILASVGLITILLVAFIGLEQRDFLQKLFSYTTVYYLLFLLSTIILKVKYQQNINYAVFSFVIVNAVLAVLYLWLERECLQHKCDNHGVLAYMPRFAKIFIFFILIACGLPISSMFWNNFILISALFRESFAVGMGVMASIILVSMALIYELYTMRDLQLRSEIGHNLQDLSDRQMLFFIGLIILMCLSFFNPLWFVF